MSEERRSAAVSWYRTPIEAAVLKGLHERSDVQGAIQTAGYLLIVGVTAGCSLYAFWHAPWYVTAGLVFLHGMVSAFHINGVHELGHGTVFKTKALNAFFVRILSFFGWINFEMFNTSHVRHHQYTLHPPEDQEVVLPLHVLVKHFFTQGFVNPPSLYNTLRDHVRIARGKFKEGWESKLFPASDPVKQSYPIHWARTLLIGHGLILAVSIYFKLWLVPVLTTFAPFFGGWLFFLCNNTQHIGLQDKVPDFRLCCRTFLLNAPVRFLYWQMNYHTEHHMYAAVPCYKLGKLHRIIEHDLPPCPRGIVATWREIAAIQAIQAKDPSYQHVALVPNRPKPQPSRSSVPA